MRLYQTKPRFAQACMVLLCALLFAPSVSAELTEQQIAFDPDVKAQIGKTGEYKLTIKGLPYRLWVETVDHFKLLKDRDKARQMGKNGAWLTPKKGQPDFSFQVWVPETYDPENPPGLVVFINSGPNGTLPKKYRELIAKKNLVVIGATESGNKVEPHYRVTYTYFAVELMNRRYTLDPDRIYITGTSGGGRAASHAMFYRPQVFGGGFPIVGCSTPIANMSEAVKREIPPMHAMPSKNALREAAMNGRYVFLTGEKDFNRKQCEQAAAYLKELGFKHVAAIVEPGIAHHNNSPAYVEQGLNFLDAPLIKAATKRYQDAENDLERKRFEDAIAGFQTAAVHLQLSGDDALRDKAKLAKEKVIQINQQYADAVKAVEDAIAAKDDKAASVALRDLQRAWRDRLSREEATAYRKRILEVKRGG